ncbi:MAG: CRISPR-associated helicase Cas3' [bacterium]
MKNTELPTYYSHSGAIKFCHTWHPLTDHLKDVHNLAIQFAQICKKNDHNFFEAVRLAALLHDLGKYGDLFQKRLRGLEKGIDHWSAGAYTALRYWRNLPAALSIVGHHLGLPDLGDKEIILTWEKLVDNHPLQLRLSENDLSVLRGRMQQDFPDLSIPSKPLSISFQKTISEQMNLRMQYSCLVDADFLDTEAHFKRNENEKVYRLSGPDLESEKAFAILKNFMYSVRDRTCSSSKVQDLRDDLWNACIQAADFEPGLRTLSAPTGSGKTYAMLGFALKHALRHSLRRIIIVIPYLTIIEQTTRAYRQVFKDHFPPEFILEDHSLVELGEKKPGDGESQVKLLAENWDAPIVITTHVKFFESLFANRPAACRKLHRLANSVILFDEVQTLPLKLAIPTLAALSHLSKEYRSTICFATATQPAFNHLCPLIQQNFGNNLDWTPEEIVPSNLNLYSRSKRTNIQLPDFEQTTSWDEITCQVEEYPQILCIVNLKRHARDIYQRLKDRKVKGLFHLSTAMCPAHREQVVEKVRQLLKNGEPCHLISTQCIEAGVDIDFPVVYRAFGPLEAIAQAAGRCNRNGLLDIGEVKVFLPEDDGKMMYPPDEYAQAASVTRIFLKSRAKHLDITQPELFQDYYRMLYNLARPESLSPLLKDAIERGDFPEIAAQYRIIKQDTVNIVVPYQPEIMLFNQLREDIHKTGLTREWIRRARPLSVGIFRYDLDKMVYLEPVMSRTGEETDWFIYTETDHYDEGVGLNPPIVDLLII